MWKSLFLFAAFALLSLSCAEEGPVDPDGACPQDSGYWLLFEEGEDCEGAYSRIPVLTLEQEGCLVSASLDGLAGLSLETESTRNDSSVVLVFEGEEGESSAHAVYRIDYGTGELELTCSGVIRQSGQTCDFEGQGSARELVFGEVLVELTPGEIMLDLEESYAFSAFVQGSINQGIDWSLDEGESHGSVDDEGLYLAPEFLPDTATVHLRARSQEDPTVSSLAEIYLMDAGADCENLRGHWFVADSSRVLSGECEPTESYSEFNWEISQNSCWIHFEDGAILVEVEVLGQSASAVIVDGPDFYNYSLEFSSAGDSLSGTVMVIADGCFISRTLHGFRID
ncbi:MAG: hypothetical protein QF492_03705 [Candidatus Krumholzibacteria bacterium]|jgi:hypothetical protein|nr:hypothetical protein [Candidatus Krumholzibacteria bacterium]MDP6669003.1 hypothetical protein [Candidatus Krumholzibacteria bacterium]MDP6797392.1 hypothetical protein [Candidatus Krumholzibacteria bacterium]MDP7021093.1 hypothetical protein [Candidatus Krumholzibacteria bacterium]